MATIRQLRGRWQAMVRRRGVPLRCKSFDKRTDATRWARELEAEADRSGWVALQGTPTSNLTLAASDASAIQVLEVVSNNPGCQTASLCNDDTDTDFDNAMSIVNTNMPNPGGGTNVHGDTPQEVLFIVSDGVDDKTSSTCSQPTISYSGGIRCQQPFDTTWCTTVKNRGIRIAVLYTEYLPLPTNSWYETGYGTFKGIAPFQPQIATNMQACASSGLYFDVQSGGDISSAMAALFQQAVATARLTQ